MTTVHKFPLAAIPDVELMMPAGARLLHVGHQDGALMLWAEVDEQAPAERRQFVVVGTGWGKPADAEVYVGTVQAPNGLVWHVFEVAPLPVPEVGEERQAMIDQLQDQAIELDMLREALGVPYEPHQSLLERMLEAARGRAGSGAAPEPPAQEPMTVAEIEDQSSYWHRWYLKTREELYAVRQGWIRVVDEFLVTRHLGIARPTDTYDEARAKLLKIIDFEIDIATDPVVGGDRVRKKVPMTDEEAKALISPVLRSVPAGDLPQVSTGYFIAMMRAVERHHGIGKGESNA